MNDESINDRVDKETTISRIFVFTSIPVLLTQKRLLEQLLT